MNMTIFLLLIGFVGLCLLIYALTKTMSPSREKIYAVPDWVIAEDEDPTQDHIGMRAIRGYRVTVLPGGHAEIVPPAVNLEAIRDELQRGLDGELHNGDMPPEETKKHLDSVMSEFGKRLSDKINAEVKKNYGK